MKHFKSIDGDFALDIPGRWNSFPPVSEDAHPEVVRLGSYENGIIHALFIYRSLNDPKQSLEEVRDQRRQHLPSEGYGNFATGETTIGERKALILDCSNGTFSMREYFVAEGRFIYVLVFSTNNKTGLSAGDVEMIILQTPRSNGPLGCTGVGEMTMVSTAPAVINAIYNACGARIFNLPAKVKAALAGKQH